MDNTLAKSVTSNSSLDALRNKVDWVRVGAWFCYAVAFTAFILNITHGPEKSTRMFWFQGDSLFPAHIVQDVLVDGNSYSTWRAPPAPFIFPDWFIVGAIQYVTGQPIFSNLAFAVINTLIITFTALGCSRLFTSGSVRNRELILALSFAFLFLLIDWDTSNRFRSAFRPAFHAGTFSFSFLCVYLFLRLDKFGLQSIWNKVLLAVLLAFAFLLGLSDLLTICYLAAPLTVAFGLALFFQRGPWLQSATVLGAVWCFIMMGAALTDSVIAREDPSSFSKISIPSIIGSFKTVIREGTNDLLRRDITHLCLLFISVVGAGGLMHPLWKRSNNSKSIDRTRAIYFGFSALAGWAVISGLIFGGSNTLWLQNDYDFSIHYWIPVFTMPFVLAPIVFEFLAARSRSTDFRRLFLTLVVVGLASTSWIAISRAAKPKEFSVWNYKPAFVEQLDSIAAKYDLHVGYADYWDARQIGLYSQRTEALPALVHPLHFFYWMTNKGWVTGNERSGQEKRPVEFVLTGGDHKSHLTPEAVKMWLGEPAAEEMIGDPADPNSHRVLIYKSKDRYYGLESLIDGYMPGLIQPNYPLEIPIDRFAYSTGATVAQGRTAIEGKDAAGHLLFGPYLQVPSGEFNVWAEVKCSGLTVADGATWDIGHVDSQQQSFNVLAAGKLGEEAAKIDADFEIPATTNFVHIEFRVYYPGKGTLEVGRIQLTRKDSRAVLATRSRESQSK